MIFYLALYGIIALIG